MIVINIDSNVDLYMIKHIIMIKLIWCVNDFKNWGHAYATVCLAISHLQSFSRTYTTASRPTGLEGIVVDIDSNVDLYMIKQIIVVKLISCANDIPNCGPAYVTMCLINKVIFILSRTKTTASRPTG